MQAFCKSYRLCSQHGSRGRKTDNPLLVFQLLLRFKPNYSLQLHYCRQNGYRNFDDRFFPASFCFGPLTGSTAEFFTRYVRCTLFLISSQASVRRNISPKSPPSIRIAANKKSPLEKYISRKQLNVDCRPRSTQINHNKSTVRPII